MGKTARAVRKQTKYLKYRDGYKTGDQTWNALKSMFAFKRGKPDQDAGYYRKLGEELNPKVAPPYGTLEYRTWYAENFPEQYAEWLKKNSPR